MKKPRENMSSLTLDKEVAHITCEMLYLTRLSIRQGYSLTKTQQERFNKLKRIRDISYMIHLKRKPLPWFNMGILLKILFNNFY